MPYCRWERKPFPEGDFEPRQGIGLVHVHNRAAGSPEHTQYGDPVLPEPWRRPSRVAKPIPSVVSDAIRDAMRKLRGH